jgi:hypothetical protein
VVKAKPPKGWSTVATAAEFLDLTPQAIRQTYLPAMADCDVDRKRTPLTLRVSAVVDLMIQRRLDETKKHQPIQSDDPLLADGDSPALERYRLAKAKHAELDLEQRKGELIDKEKCRDVLARWGSTIRKMGDRISKRFGIEANQMVSEAIDECESIVKGLANADD